MKLYTTELEDGTLFLEWVADKVRFGISIEANLEESCWYFVSTGQNKAVSGYFGKHILEELRKRLNR